MNTGRYAQYQDAQHKNLHERGVSLATTSPITSPGINIVQVAVWAEAVVGQFSAVADDATYHCLAE